ncbi:MAG: histidine triad nucleotide-binding protein [Clostridia bacterium]|nr:histidine triad nucleotide-binding protein [Clostridia bacterium]MBR0408004.1 histidine triad nucleotide-binding protein [Clostridia bacterium]
MENCLFCKIIAGDIPSTKVYEDGFCYAFRDINPQAPTHILVVPKQHVSSIAEMHRLPDDALCAIMRAIGKIAEQEGLVNGFRVISNCGPDACQSVPHLHFHILGGRQMADQMA